MWEIDTERFPSRQRITFRIRHMRFTDNIPRMANLHDRIRERLIATGKTLRKAGLDGGLSGDAIGKMLKNADQSQTLETIHKLAVGLNTSPEWLAFGIGNHDACANMDKYVLPVTESSSSVPLYKSRLRDTDYIQVEKGVLQSLLLEALLKLDVPSRKAEAYTDGVLGFLEGHQDATVVVRLATSARSASGSPALAPADPS